MPQESKTPRTFETQGGGPGIYELSNDGKTLVAVTTRLVRIWNLAGADEKLTLKGHAAAITSVVFSLLLASFVLGKAGG